MRLCVTRCFAGFLLSASLAHGAPHSGAGREVTVDTCGQLVTQGRGVLRAHLDCSGSDADSGVTILRGTLDLRGFTLTAPSYSQRAVICDDCRIVGPGTIVGGGVVALTLGSAVKASDVSMVGPAIFAFSGSRTRLIRVNAVGFDVGISGGGKAKVVESSLVGSGNTGYGIAVPDPARVILVRSTVGGFGTFGVFAFAIRLTDSVVIGNAVDPTCDTTCADLVCAESAPILRGASSCDSSLDPFPFPGRPWGVCSDD